MSAFEELGICPELAQATEEAEWTLPSDIQAECIPYILTGRDVAAAAETGSGKTGAFALPCLQIVHEELRTSILRANLNPSPARNSTAPTSNVNVPGPNPAESNGPESAGAEGVTGSSIQFDPSDKDAFVVILDEKDTKDKNRRELTAKCENGAVWSGIRTTAAIATGKYEWEVELLNDGGLIRVGASGLSANRNLGRDSMGWGFGGTGKKVWNNDFEDYGAAYKTHDVISVCLDRTNRCIGFKKNGVDLGVAFRLPPSTDDKPLRPHICGKNFLVALRTNGLKHPTPGFQPLAALSVKDMGVGAITESGSIIRSGGAGGGGRQGTEGPFCLVLEPTRDLADQVYCCFSDMSKNLTAPSLSLCLCVGGGDDSRMRRTLASGVDVVVGTLPKISQLIRCGELRLNRLRFLILDEADDLIKNDLKNTIGHIQTVALTAFARARGTPSTLVHKVTTGAPMTRPLQTLFFSATLHGVQVREAVAALTTNAVWIDLKGRPTVPASVHAVICPINPLRPQQQQQPGTPAGGNAQEKAMSPELVRLNKLLERVSPKTDGVHARDSLKDDETARLSVAVKIAKMQAVVRIADALNMESCGVFCRTNLDCDNLEDFLCRLSAADAGTTSATQNAPHNSSASKQNIGESGRQGRYSCVVLAGARQQRERTENLQLFKSGIIRFLICTDVAARGIDIAGLPFLIMMNVSDDCDQWFHRVGRVGRAERMGLAITLMAEGVREKVWYHKNCTRAGGRAAPARGSNATGSTCQNTKLLEHGGCCMMYDEGLYMEAIKNRMRPLPDSEEAQTFQDPFLYMTYPDCSIIGLDAFRSGAITNDSLSDSITASPAKRRARQADRESRLASQQVSKAMGEEGRKNRAWRGEKGEENAPKDFLKIYGQSREALANKQPASDFLRQILPIAADLAALETTLQRTYLRNLLRSRRKLERIKR